MRDAFIASYKKNRKGANKFTKVHMAYPADQLLKDYFARNLSRVESWFNIIAPRGKSLVHLRGDLNNLAGKNWAEIHT